MTRFIDVDDLVALTREIGIEKFLSDMAGYIAEDYRHWGDFEKAPRIASHSALGVIELMPTSNGRLYGFKYVNGHPANVAKNLPNVVAFGALADVETGVPLMLCEMTLLTAMRTAAMSAVAAKAMARSGSRIMAVIGCGAQCEFQILAFKAVLGVDEVRLFDLNPAAIEKVLRNLAGVKDLRVTIASSASDAVKGADIVSTMTAAKTRTAVLTPDMVEAGMHINAIGGDCPGKTELHPDVVRGARVGVEYEPQTRHEGEIQQMPADFTVTEMWKILTGVEPGRRDEAEVTLFDSVGFAINDFSALRYLRDVAVAHNAGSDIGLIPHLADPRDLFTLLRG
ncbi:MAG: ornithine cyclodeaminase [Alphaproteobacteria bacterium]|nr:ornithine cyclodeaminase [Alphaproteobacteria bacterium]